MPLAPIALAVIFLSACGPAIPPGVACISTCGLMLRDPASCEGFLAAEAASLGAFARDVTDTQSKWDISSVCSKFSGYVVQLHPGAKDAGGVWTDEYGRRVLGETWCAGRVVELGKDDYGDGVFTHELAHVAEECVDTDGDSHYRWEEKGILKAIEDAKSHLDGGH